jgi:tetratricopeptide (TPR) repeat protein
MRPSPPLSKAGQAVLAETRDYRRRSDFVQAIERLRGLEGVDQDHPAAQFELGYCFVGLNRLEEAEAAFKSVLDRVPKAADAIVGLGVLEQMWINPKAALARFREALEIDPDHANARTRSGDALRELGRLEEAEAVYREVLATKPTFAFAWRGLGQVYRERYDFVAALEAFRRFADIEPTNPLAHAALGNALCDAGDPIAAREAFAAALKLAPTDISAMLGRVRSLWLSGEIALAREALMEVEQAHPANPRVEFAATRVANGLGRFDWRADIRQSIAVAKSSGVEPARLMMAMSKLLEYGFLEPLEPSLSELAARSPRARRIQLEARALERSELTWRKSTDPTDLQGFIEALRPGARTIVIVFAGREERLFLGVELLHRVLRAHEVSVVYLRDLERTRYFGGVVALGSSVDATCVALRAIVARAGAERVLMIGSCMGAAAALRYGLELEAEAVLGLSPNLTPWDGPMTLEAQSKLAAMQAIDSRFFDKIGEIVARAARRPKITLIYGASCPADAADATTLDGLAGVELVGIENYSEHNTLIQLLAHGLLAPTLTEYLTKGELNPELSDRIRASEKSGAGTQDVKAFHVRLPASRWF